MMSSGNQRLQARLPWLVGAVLLALILWRVAAMFQPPVSDVSVEPATQLQSTEQPAAPAQDYAALAQLHLFGVPESKAPAPPPKKEIPETRAQLKLHGVFVGEESTGAIIGEQNGRQQFVRVGGAITDGIELKEVHQDHVVIERNGKVESLRFPKAERLASEPEAQAPVVVSTPDTGQPLDVVNLQELETEEIARYLRAFPVKDQGAFVGYRVLPGRDRSLYQALGLRPGDVITTVNGQPVEEAGGPDGFLQQLSANRNPAVTVRRGPETLQLQAGG